jgi:hypothetical protein
MVNGEAKTKRHRRSVRISSYLSHLSLSIVEVHNRLPLSIHFTMARLLPLIPLLSLLGAADALPMQVTVNQRQNECLYDTLDKE